MHLYLFYGWFHEAKVFCECNRTSRKEANPTIDSVFFSIFVAREKRLSCLVPTLGIEVSQLTFHIRSLGACQFTVFESSRHHFGDATFLSCVMHYTSCTFSNFHCFTLKGLWVFKTGFFSFMGQSCRYFPCRTFFHCSNAQITLAHAHTEMHTWFSHNKLLNINR